MHSNQTTAYRDAAAAFRSSFAIRRAIGLAIWRARGQAPHASHDRIRIVPMQPERKTWYECSTCGRAGTTTWNNQRHCARCGALAIRHAWVGPDVAAAERRVLYARHARRNRPAWAEREPSTGSTAGLRRWAWSTR